MNKPNPIHLVPRETLAAQRAATSAPNMARIHGVSTALMYKVLQRHGISGPHGSAKMTPAMVREIRIKLGQGVKPAQLALEYGISRGVISRVGRRLAWKWVR